MDDEGETEEQGEETVDKEVRQVLLEAKIVARWAKKPFYVA